MKLLYLKTRSGDVFYTSNPLHHQELFHTEKQWVHVCYEKTIVKEAVEKKEPYFGELGGRIPLDEIVYLCVIETD